MGTAVKIVLGGVAVVGLVVGVGAWQALRTEAIPDELEALDPAEPENLVLEGMGGLPDLDITTLRGQTTVLAIMGPKAWEEGKDIHAALNRWSLPDTTTGYIVGDAAGFGLFRGKVEQMLSMFREELRFPLYVDFTGAILDQYKLPKGHYGLVVLDPGGEVILRHSGAMSDEQIAGLKQALGASDAPAGPPAPTFVAGPATNESCAGKACVLAFMGRTLGRSEIPGIDGGKEAKAADAKRIMADPDLRTLMTVLSVEEFEKDVQAVAIAQLVDLEPTGWTVIETADGARKAFDLGPTDSALIVIDAEGRTAFREVGIIPQWKTSRAMHLLGAKVKRRSNE